jgi:hypothetical protein
VEKGGARDLEPVIKEKRDEIKRFIVDIDHLFLRVRIDTARIR